MYGIYIKSKLEGSKWLKIKELKKDESCVFIKWLIGHCSGIGYNFFVVEEGEDWKIKLMQSEGVYND